MTQTTQHSQSIWNEVDLSQKFSQLSCSVKHPKKKKNNKVSKQSKIIPYTELDLTQLIGINIDQIPSYFPIPPYPSVNRVGEVSDHDRPYADYGHLDANTIARVFDFNLETGQIITKNFIQDHRPVRMNRKSFAITCWTNVLKEEVMNEIEHIFTIEKLQYVCVAQEFNSDTINQEFHLHLQIVLKEVVNKKTSFLDSVTVTHNDRAWNEYIKKSLNYIEFSSFKSTIVRGVKYWSSQHQHKSS
ncbi:unnamed protein product [Rotaria magnacalcarata]|uniref:Uncharacterized protein n=1 Tax=Rotaria magnacalcarata TaxID=392030 RepID=A0A820BEQ8_9BILA|nr:unnamed protein product [Rotaria magnacalcarata]